MNEFVVLSNEQIEFMVKVMDYILSHPTKTVAEIKTIFGLSSEQYEMIYSLAMPRERHRNLAGYYKSKYTYIYDHLAELIRAEKKHTKLTDSIWAILQEAGVRPKNQAAKIEVEEAAEKDQEPLLMSL